MPESPTTARPLEMDDDDVQETGVLGEETPTKPNAPATGITTVSATAATPAVGEEVAPPKPPRPVTEEQKNQQILKEAFPSIDDGVIRAVLRASGGRMDPAFNALLGEITVPSHTSLRFSC